MVPVFLVAMEGKQAFERTRIRADLPLFLPYTCAVYAAPLLDALVLPGEPVVEWVAVTLLWLVVLLLLLVV